MSVVAFSHLAIRVSDLDDALARYRDHLGFAGVSRLVVRDTPSFREAGLDDVEMEAWFGARDGTTIELQSVTSRSGQAIPAELNQLGFRHLAFRVDDVDATAEHLQACGGRIDAATRTENPDVGGAAIFGADPDGQRLELLRLDGGPHQPIGEPLLTVGASPEPGGEGAVSRLSHIGVGVGELAHAKRFYSEALSATVESETAHTAMVRVGDTRLCLEQVDASTPHLGIRYLLFEGPQSVQIDDPNGPRLVIATPQRTRLTG